MADKKAVYNIDINDRKKSDTIDSNIVEDEENIIDVYPEEPLVEKQEETVIEAYVRLNNQLIIAVSGLSGSGKNRIAKELAKDFDMQYLNLHRYYKEGFNETIELPSGEKVINWDSPEAYNWDNFNKDVDKAKDKGVVISGPYFPSGYFDFNINVHINIKMSKQNILDARHEKLEKGKVIDSTLNTLSGTDKEKLIFNSITFPQYLDEIKKSYVTKFINANEMSLGDIYDSAFNHVMDIIIKFLSGKGEIKFE